ncbi:MAG: hypothetical protein HOQ05_03370 [Corynebacteriales bacterium]|nr:hypothetical protein [Mycobacteriales bacterium]
MEKDVWVRRPLGPSKRLTAWMPYETGGHRLWLKQVLGQRTRPYWNKDAHHWEISRVHLRHLVDALVRKFNSVDVFLQFRANETCDRQCRRATGIECSCSCLGQNHGEEQGGAYWKNWQQIGDVVLIDGAIKERQLRVMDHIVSGPYRLKTNERIVIDPHGVNS